MGASRYTHTCFVMLATSLAGAQVTTLDQWTTDPGGSSSQFGAAMAVSSKRLCIGSPSFDYITSGRGRTWFFDPKTLLGMTYSNLGAASVTGYAREGTALAALKSDILFGVPGLTVSTFASAGAAVYYNEK